MKPPGQRTGKPSRKSAQPPPHQRRFVERLAAAGLNGDVISQILNVNKNKLRREHAVALYSGRKEAEEQKAAETEASGGLTSEEKHAANVILDSFASEWVDPVCGNLLWEGFDGSGAKTAAEAYAAWLRGGAKFITTGLGESFGPERIAEFVALKREAQRLLGALVEHRLRRGEAEHHT